MSRLTGTAEAKPALEWRSAVGIWPWLGGMALSTWLGQFDGRKVIPFWWDMALVAAFSLAVFYWAVRVALPPVTVAGHIDAHKDEAGFDSVHPAETS